jgi:hypothetical protein
MHLSYNAIEKNATWYAPGTRRDGGHLMGSAAKLFSAQIGRDFAALVKKASSATR